MTINYAGLGTSSACCQYPAMANPNSLSGQIESVDCSNNKFFLTDFPATINPDGTCGCGATVNVQETTWGQIKAMYSTESQ